VFYPFYRLQAVCQPLRLDGRAFYRDYLQAVVVVQMDMLRRNYHPAKIMLDIHKPVHQFPLMVVIKQGDRPGNLPAAFPLLLDQLLADKVAESLRTVSVFLFLDQAVKLCQQIAFYGNPETINGILPWLYVFNCIILAYQRAVKPLFSRK